MASLLCDLHFWTIKEDVIPKDTDQSTFKYYDKSQHKAMLDRPYGQVGFLLFQIIETLLLQSCHRIN